MDIFQTVFKGLEILYRFFDPLLSHKEDSESLALRLRWDLKILNTLLVSMQSVQQEEIGQDQAEVRLWNDSATYLRGLADRLLIIQSTIQNRSKMFTWWAEEPEYRELERELFEWTQRFDLRLITLPYSMRQNIDLTSLDATIGTPFLAAQRRIEIFRREGQIAIVEAAQNMLIENHVQQFGGQMVPGRHTFARFNNQTVIVEYKKTPRRLLPLDREADRQVFKNQRAEMCAILHRCQPSTTGVLKSLGFFEENSGPNPQYGLVYAIPTSLTPADQQPRMLSSMFLDSVNHPLNQRFELARKLATSVLFLHAVEWVHKAIRPTNIIVLQSNQVLAKYRYPRSLGDPYLVGMEAARSFEEFSDPTQRVKNAMFERDIYLHPYRVSEGVEVDTPYTMVHDVYSLGVVLLEIGFWKPINSFRSKFLLPGTQPGAANVALVAPPERKRLLLKLAKTSATCISTKYADIVQTCLNVEGNEIKDANFVGGILERLEKLSIAMN